MDDATRDRLRRAFAGEVEETPQDALSAQEWAELLGCTRRVFFERADAHFRSGRMACIGAVKRPARDGIRQTMVPLYRLVEVD